MISIQSVSKAFRPAGGGPPNQVLEGVSLDVPASCLYGLIGPGASGKSVLLKMIVGLLKPDAGSILVDGADVTQASELDLQKMRLKFGMLFQNNALFDHMTVGDNIAFPLRRLTDLPEDQIKSRVMERLAHVALTGFEGRLPAGLSGGQKKRVGADRPLRRARSRPRSGHLAEDLRAPPRGAAGLGRHRDHGVERSRSTPHRHRSRRHDVPRSAHLRRDDSRSEDQHRAARPAVRAWPDRRAALTAGRTIEEHGCPAPR